ncbi:hypothetical protein N180_06960 [Pedobacter antarcticus 4BY]|uniref:MalT-like TPR region domain-containing protein n=2 Tax=Pedobacter antarcticus TaxID=34086 RepID=A0A081PF07_9SPHI|nr:hypothetical protein [Pedobacter antarcticus]KEQ29280.1 hypothetical protein N180_06960 [Pedobacter antarcticus 4BY]SFE75963.1 hypothetical protein SAMN03003324_01362 [Pedobacter antarcticus]
MYKLCLGLVFLINIVPASAQSSNYVLQEPYISSGAINVAVSRDDGDLYFEEGEKNEKSGDLNDAITFFGKAAFEYNNVRNFSRYGASLLRLSHVHYLMQHYTEAEQVILNVALKTYSKSGNRSGQMASYNQLGRIYLASNKLTQSMWFYTQQGILARQTNSNLNYIDSMLGIIRVKIKKREYAMALKDIQRVELLTKNTNAPQYQVQLRQVRAVIAEKKAGIR